MHLLVSISGAIAKSQAVFFIQDYLNKEKSFWQSERYSFIHSGLTVKKSVITKKILD